MMNRRSKKALWFAIAAMPALALTACSNQSSGGDGGGATTNEAKTLKLANSYTLEQPQNKCGAEVIKSEVEKADVGLTIDIFPASQLGGDADRVASVVDGSIDMDLQGASALGSVYAPVAVMDGAYVFDDSEALAKFMASDQAKQVFDGFKSASQIQVLGAWNTGGRDFTANKAIRKPEDLKGLRMRFPGSPQYLMNAKALGAEATEVAYEELYLALQQGTVDGQENPITNIKASNLQEVQKFISLSEHSLSTNLIIMGPVYDTLSDDQKKALTDATTKAVSSVTDCVKTEESATLDEWKAGKKMAVVEDVDREAFKTKARAYLKDNYTGDSLKVYNSIQEVSGN